METVARIRLIEERKRRQWSQQEAADKIGTTQRNVSRWERGKTTPGAYFRAKLCALFGTSLQELGLLGDPADEAHLHLTLPDAPSIPTPHTSSPSTEHRGPLWQVPFPRNPFFTGRDHVLHELHAVLHYERATLLSQSYALSGLGGIGKTQTALEYAYRYAPEYMAVFWISAETAESLFSSCVALAEVLQLPVQDDSEQSRVVTAVLRWLTSHAQWLLIVDNIEDLEVAKGFLPPARQGALLFTSRKPALGISTHTLDVDQLTAAEGLRFLLHRARLLDPATPLDHLAPAELAAAQEIVAAMNGLPLALDQAGAYLEATRCTLADYLLLLRSAPLRLLDEREASAEHPLSVTKTFTLAFEHLERTYPAAAAMLTVCAFLAPEAIPEAVFLEGAAPLGPPFQALAADPFQFQAALKALLASSLLQRQAATHTLIVHRLVQAVLKGRLSEETQRAWAGRVVQAMAALFPSRKAQVDYWSAGAYLLPHALSVLALSEQWQTDPLARIPLMSHVATYLLNRGQVTEAEQWAQRAVCLAEHAFGSEHPQAATAIEGVANLYREQGHYVEAEQLYRRALYIREHALFPDDALVAESLHSVAALCSKQGHYAEAEQLRRRALHLRERLFAAEDPLIAESLNSLGVLYLDQERHQEAELLLQRAVHLLERTLGPDHPLLAESLSHLAEIYKRRGTFAEAERCYQRAVQIREQALGPEHPLLARTLYGLADLYREMYHYAEAEPFFQRAWRLTEQAFGLEHPMIAQLLFGLAELRKEQGNSAEAERLYQRLVGLQDQLFGREHFYQTYPLCGLAELSRSQGDYAQAEQFLRRAWQTWEDMGDSEHPDRAYIFIGLARVCANQQRYAEAEAFYRRALRLREQHLGPDHLATEETLHELVKVYCVQDKCAEALPLAERVLVIRERVFGAEHPRTGEARTQYADLLRGMERKAAVQGTMTRAD